MTGAPLPAGADAVVMIEQTSRVENRIRVDQALRPGDNYIAPREAKPNTETFCSSRVAA